MFRIAVAVLMLGSLVLTHDATPQPGKTAAVYTGRIYDVWGAIGVLKLTVTTGDKTRVETFSIQGARIVGPTGSEWKVGDLRKGDKVEVEWTPDGMLVQEVRVVAEPARKDFSLLAPATGK